MKAVTPGDLAHASLPVFKRRVDAALAVIRDAAALGRIGVSFSGGKDSTVLLHLIRQVVPDVPAAFYDSGCEYDWTHEMVAHYGATVVRPQMSLLEMCRYGGYWGYSGPGLVDPDAEFDFGGFLIAEPSARFGIEQDLTVVALGLRAQENHGRRMNARRRGELYWVESEQLWHLCPLALWTHDDVWAYIASRGLRYHVAYDRLTELGIPRAQQRVGPLLGEAALSIGRYCYLRMLDPCKWNELVAEFPKMASFT